MRKAASHIYNFAARAILRTPFDDHQCGFKAMTAELFRQVAPQIENNDWFFDTELIIFAKRQSYSLKEIPVDWREDRYEKRKSHIKLLRDSWIFYQNLVKLKKRLQNDTNYDDK